ncbi:arsenate reductase ArsC [Hydrogenovibrio thermophilus]|uniref:Arsenate reductase ArsC n=1 Tax=Hydrogenovibrio thermophilus TaxID=265883 RepID=A0A410H525_9GAMM|nr:arsenate reductase ArsC [Hydrogenovibrio thermophilus]QAB16034.1 arsenate reductase ArsC [Hydrogenovibrio thermophilus]
MFNVLFLCTGNSKRSVMAEALLNHWGKGRFKAYSAGSHPKDSVNEDALTVLQHSKIRMEPPRTKSWDEFAQPGAPVMDFVITVCDKAKGEVCPVWPGQPMTAHWGVEDPQRVEGDNPLKQYKEVLRVLDTRIKLFTILPFEKLERLKLKQKLDEIGLERGDEAE